MVRTVGARAIPTNVYKQALAIAQAIKWFAVPRAQQMLGPVKKNSRIVCLTRFVQHSLQVAEGHEKDVCRGL